MFSDPARQLDGVRFSADGVCPVLGDLLAGEGGGEHGEPHAVLGHLPGERGGLIGPGRKLQRKAGQVGQFRGTGGDDQVDDAGQCRGEKLVKGRPDGRLVRGAAGQLCQQLDEQSGFPALSGGEPGGASSEGGQLRGVGQVLLDEQVRPQRIPVVGSGVQPVRPRCQRLGPQPGDLGLVRKRREQGHGACLVGGCGQRGQCDHLIGQRQIRVEGQMHPGAQVIPAGPFPLAQCPQQPRTYR